MSSLQQLKRLLSERYDTLKAQVAYKLGGASDMAGDALHDAFMQLSSHNNLDQVQHPHSYLVTSALHTAIDQLRSDARWVSTAEIDALFELPDQQPGPEEQLEAKQQLQQLMQALEALPARQCALLIDARVHGLSSAELAQKWNISASMVRREIRQAHQFCLQALPQAEQTYVVKKNTARRYE